MIGGCHQWHERGANEDADRVTGVEYGEGREGDPDVAGKPQNDRSKTEKAHGDEQDSTDATTNRSGGKTQRDE